MTEGPELLAQLSDLPGPVIVLVLFVMFGMPVIGVGWLISFFWRKRYSLIEFFLIVVYWAMLCGLLAMLGLFDS
jgi:hypothetical protein